MKTFLIVLCLVLASSVRAKPGRVIGYVDVVKDKAVHGWACQKGEATSLSVHVYVGGPAGKGSFLKAGTANLASEPAVARECATGFDRYRYVISFSDDEVRQNANSQVFVHGIASVPGVPNDLLGNSGKFLVSGGNAPTPPPLLPQCTCLGGELGGICTCRPISFNCRGICSASGRPAVICRQFDQFCVPRASTCFCRVI